MDEKLKHNVRYTKEQMELIVSDGTPVATIPIPSLWIRKHIVIINRSQTKNGKP